MQRGGLLLSGSAHLGETLALPRLMTRLSPLAASLVLGVVWAAWHAPTFLISEQSDSAVPYGGFVVLTIATSVIVAWLYIRSGGSVLLCALFHAVADAAYSYTGVVGREHSAFWTAVVLEVAVAAWLAVRGGWRTHSGNVSPRPMSRG